MDDPPSNDDDVNASSPPDHQEQGLSADDIDAQYLRAVEAMDDADWEIGDVSVEAVVDEELAEKTQSDALSPSSEAQPVETAQAETQQQRFSPAQILEAALFVGGKPLSSKKLAGLVGGSFDGGGVQVLIDELNLTYAAEARPYEIRLGEGGYSLSLRESYDRVRNRVFGVGPREVKLSHDALEILAFVAYQQPVTREDAEQTGKQNAGSLLSQLVRRQLIAIRRDEENPKQVSYHTSDRFLSVFGIGSLDELPLAGGLETK